MATDSSKDSTAAAQLARDQAAAAAKTDASNDGTAAAQLARDQAAAAAAKAKRIAEYKKLAEYVEKLGSKIETANNKLADVMEKLNSALTGKTANELSAMMESAQDMMTSLVDYYNTVGNDISQKLKNEGETFSFQQLDSNSKNYSDKSSSTVFSYDLDSLKENVKPALEETIKYIEEAYGDATGNIPKVDDYDMSDKSGTIDDINTDMNNILKNINNTIENIEQLEAKNKTF